MRWLLAAGLLAAAPALAQVPASPVSPAGPTPQAPPPAEPPPSVPAPAPAPAAGGNPLARLLLLPDLSAIGRGALAWNQLDAATLSPRADPVVPARKLEPVFQELEVALQAVVDPYARADVFLSFTPAGAAVEEAYLTSLDLPAGFQVKAGTLYAPFGRQNQQHAHVWDFADMPLAQARLLAASGLKGPGLDVAWLAPLPWFAELHLAYQNLTPAFEADGRRALLARLSQFFDLADGVTLGLGLSAARLDEPAGLWRDLYGGDLFLKVRPTSGRAYLALQGELFARRFSGAGAGDVVTAGGYAQALWRQSAFWAVGARWDGAPSAGAAPPGREHRFTGLLAWTLTEFQRLRLQVSYDRLAGGRDGFEALLAVDFAIGVHGAHPF